MIKKLNQIHCEDCFETLSSIDDEFIDLTITSPPYNVNLGNDRLGVTDAYDIHNDNMPYETYLDWLKIRFELLFTKTKKFGRCVINIGDQKNGAIPLSSDVIQFMKIIGWLPLTHIIWNKNQCNPRTAWGSWLSPKQPSFPTPFEHILVFAKEDLNLNRKGETDLTKQEFIDFSLALWTMTTAKKSKTNHPAAFPEELPYRCIKMFSYIGDIVYDPFAGSCTTLKVAKKLNRKWIGSEISRNYCDLMN